MKKRCWIIPGILLVLGALAAPAALAQGQTVEYNQPANAVISALARHFQSAYPDSPIARSNVTGIMTQEVRTQNRSQISTPSNALANPDLLQAVRENDQPYVGNAAGRYVLSVVVEPRADGGTTVRVVPLIVVDVGTVDSFIGGRPLRSSGTVEGAFVAALNNQLGQ